jgi:hypothetical protein
MRTHKLHRHLARLTALIMAAGVVVTTDAGPSWAGTCERTVVISPQITVREGDQAAVFGLYSAGCAAAGTVTYRITPGSGIRPATGQVTWAAGETRAKPVAVAVVDDSVAEPALETFTVTLVNPTPGLRLPFTTAQGRVADDDSSARIWAVDDNTCSSGPWLTAPGTGVPGYRGVEFGVKIRPLCGLGGGAISAIPNVLDLLPATITWSTVDGTARAGVDFVGVDHQVLTVPVGAGSAELPLRLLPQRSGTPRRWFYVRIDSVSAGALADPIAQVVIEPL